MTPSLLGSIRFRILAAFLAAVLAMVGAIGFLIVQFQGVSESLAMVTEGYLPLKDIVGRLDRDNQRVKTDLERLLREERRPATGIVSTARIYTDELKADLEVGRVHARQAQTQARDPSEVAVVRKILLQLDRIETLFRDYEDHSSRFLQLAEAGDRQGAASLSDPLRQDQARLDAEIDTLGRMIDGRIDHLTEETEQARLRATAISGSIVAVSALVLFALIMAVLYALRPIGRLTTQVQRLAAGDYSGRVEVRGTDEVALLATEFNAMVAAVKDRDATLMERADQLKRLSAYLASVLDSLVEALLVVEDGKVTLSNPAAVRVWGAHIGEPPPHVLLPHIAAAGRHEIAGPGATLHEVRATPYGDQGMLVVVADNTEATRQKQQLARSERLALVGQMLAQITHEVRNPLNALSLNAELLAEELGGLDAERKTEAWEILAVVSREIERLTAVTAHYLQLARRPKPSFSRVSLPDLARGVARLLAAELQQAGVGLRLDLDDLPPHKADGNQLQQAMLNLVRNSVEAGAKTLVLSVSQPDTLVQISLSDDGPGMSQEEIERAFDPFFSTKASGTGLGLAITRQILEDHEGTVRVISAPDRGTTVVLAFPARAAPVEEGMHADDPGGR